MASGMKGKRRGAAGKTRFRPNARRQFLYAALTAVAILGGFGTANLLKETDKVEPKKTADAADVTNAAAPAVPWYKTRPPPPSLITAPDAPIFPDGESQSARAYEEALPREIFVPEDDPQPPVALPSPPPVDPRNPHLPSRHPLNSRRYPSGPFRLGGVMRLRSRERTPSRSLHWSSTTWAWI